MISFGPSQRYHLYREATDMRKSFDGLCGLISSGLGRDPLSGEVFVFINRRRTHIKLLVWDRSGEDRSHEIYHVLYYKRLEEGTFELPAAPQAGPLTWQQLLLMLEGVSLESARYRRRYVLPASAPSV